MTKIEWTDETWNPLRGCSRVSEGCRNCYAEKVAFRFSGPGMPYEGLAARHPSGEGRWTGKVRLVESALDKPLRWRKPRRVFVNSMSDLFHEAVPDAWIDRVFAVMALAPRHTFQVLTKRPGRMRAYLSDPEARHRVMLAGGGTWGVGKPWGGWPLPNVWLGVSAEDQPTWDARVAQLAKTPAAVRFVSLEPMLAGVDCGLQRNVPGQRMLRWHRPLSRYIDWIIVGGESGPGARPCDVAWIRSLVAQASIAGTACFVKQLGACAADPRNGLAGSQLDIPPEAIPLVSTRLRDRKGGDWTEWPADLRVREFPEVSR